MIPRSSWDADVSGDEAPALGGIPHGETDSPGELEARIRTEKGEPSPSHRGPGTWGAALPFRVQGIVVEGGNS
jgi:hypothetical protein